MKNLVSMSIILIWLSNFSSFSVLSVQLFRKSPLKHPISDQPTLQHRVIKRQSSDESTSTPEDWTICDAELWEVSCTAGIQQGYIEAVLSCNYMSIEEAQREANVCAKGESGQSCGSLWDHYRIRSNNIGGNCSRALMLNSYMSIKLSLSFGRL